MFINETVGIVTSDKSFKSALLVWFCSVLNRSPEHLIKEIILVDDFSDNGECVIS